MCYSYFMKNALKKFKVWIIAIALIVGGIGIPFGLFFITLNFADNFTIDYPITLGLFAAIYLLIGFIWGDLYVANWRRKNKNWDDKLPDEIKENAWTRHWPFYLAAITVFLVFISFEITYWISGGYPLIHY